MRTLKRIGLFILLKVGEIGGVILLSYGFFKGVIWVSENSSKAVNIVGYACVGVILILLTVLSISLMVDLLRANWRYVKRKIK